jgi:subtilisin
MKRITLFAAGTLILAGCQEAPQPTALDPSEASSARAGSTVDVIVSLKPDFAAGAHAANQARAAEVARSLGVEPTHAYGTALFGFAATIPEGRLNALRNDPRVAHVDFDAPVSIPDRAAAPPWMGGGGSSGETLPWGVDRIDADLNANEGTGIHVYIIDTGIDSDHPDLQANLGNGYAVETCKGGGCNYAWDDDHDHGTHVAGTVGAIDNDIDVIGVASKVTLHAVKVLSKAGSGTRSGVIAGVDWVADQTATVIKAPTVVNMSLGGSGSKVDECTSTGLQDKNGDGSLDPYHRAICNAARVGVVFAVAAGNDGADAQGAVPAAYDDAVVTVSATSSLDQYESWSNWGDNSAAWTTNASAPVAIGAPGGSILSTKRGGGTTTMSGTSMASPHVAGGLALYLKTRASSTSPLTADYSAFTNARSALLSAAETTPFGSEDTTNPHDEDFLDAEKL